MGAWPRHAMWTAEEDRKLQAVKVLGIHRAEASERFLPGRSPHAIRMRLAVIIPEPIADNCAKRFFCHECDKAVAGPCAARFCSLETIRMPVKQNA